MNRNCWYAKLRFIGDTDFEIVLGRSKAGNIRLLRSGAQVEIKTEGVKSRYVRFTAEVEKIEKIEIFVDRRLVEVYINGGEKVGTKLFYQDENDGIFEADFEKEEQVKQIELYEMKGIWR